MSGIIEFGCWLPAALLLYAVRRQRVFWPLLGLLLLLLFNQVATPGFFALSIRNGQVHGSLIDILNQGSKVMVLALGMTLVIATGGVDLSVGAVMAIAGAVAARLDAGGMGGAAAIAIALVVGLAAGAWNGVLVASLGIQPIIATLVLMVAGRGVAQLITDGQIIDLHDPLLNFIGNGSFLGLPFPVLIVLGLLLLTAALTRRTSLGLFLEAAGDNERASHASGVPVRAVKFWVYGFCGLCAGVAGLLAAANIKCADANHAGLYLELDAILAVVVGGTALTGGRFYLAGSLVGALLIQTLTTTMYARNVSAEVAPVPKALVIIAVCLLQSEKFRGWFRRRKRKAAA
jgi:simple sugar transport system permease protein